MNWIDAAVLGAVQGVTEFLPVSSSAHLRLVAALAGREDPGAAFTAVTQLGTAAAVALSLRSDLARIGTAWLRSMTDPAVRATADARTGWLIMFGTLPIGLLGYTLRDAVEGPARDLRVTAGALAGVGLLLGAADRRCAEPAGGGGAPGRPARSAQPAPPRRAAAGEDEPGARGIGELSVRDGLLIGLAQAAALVPGVSRSGATISTGLLLGYSRDAAARYSFLLAIPAVTASGLFELLRLTRAPALKEPGTTAAGRPADRATGPAGGHTAAATAAATAIAFVVGQGAITWFLRSVPSRGFTPFVRYRIGLGLLLGALVTRERLRAVPVR